MSLPKSTDIIGLEHKVDALPDGWVNNSFEVGGKEYCDAFLGNCEKISEAPASDETKVQCTDRVIGILQSILSTDKLDRAFLDTAERDLKECIAAIEADYQFDERYESLEGEPATVSDIFERWGIKHKPNKKAEKASQSYDLETIYTVDARIQMCEQLSFETQERFCGGVVFDKRQVAGLLANGKLEQSRYAFLLHEDLELHIENRLQEALDELDPIQATLQRFDAQRKLELDILTGPNMQEDPSREREQHVRDLLELSEKRIEEVQAKMSPLVQEISDLSFALSTLQIYMTWNVGQRGRAGRILNQLQDRYGSLQQVDPELNGLHQEVLQPLLRHGAMTYPEYLRRTSESQQGGLYQAIIELNEEHYHNPLVDVFDQLTQDSPVHYEIQPAKKYLQDKMSRKKYPYYITLYLGNKQHEFGLSQEAKEAIDSMPSEAQFVLFYTPKSSLEWEPYTDSRQQLRDSINPEECELTPDSFGYFKGSTLYRSSHETYRADRANSGQLNAYNQYMRRRSFYLLPYQQPYEKGKFSEGDTGLRHPLHSREEQKGIAPQRSRAFTELLHTIQFQSGKRVEGVRVTPEAMEMLQSRHPNWSVVFKTDSPADILLSEAWEEYSLDRYETERTGKHIGTRKIQFVEGVTTVDVQDLVFARIEDGVLFVKDHEGNITENPVNNIRLERERKAQALVEIVDHAPPVQRTCQRAFQIGSELRHLQSLFAGKKYEELVTWGQDRAEPLLALLQDQKTKQDVAEAKEFLTRMKGTNLGLALGGVEEEIDNRIKALDSFTKILESDRTLHVVKTILDKSKFNPDTFAEWVKNDSLEWFTALSVAAVAVIAIPETFGTSATIAVTAIASLATKELTAETVHLLRYTFDEDVRNGRRFYSKRSRFGAYQSGDELYDPATGKYKEMEFLKDVAIPYGTEALIAIATGFAAAKITSFGREYLRKMAQNSTFLETLGRNSEIVSRIQNGLIYVGERSTQHVGRMRTFLDEMAAGLRTDLSTGGAQKLLETFDMNMAGLVIIVGAAQKGLSLKTRKAIGSRIAKAFSYSEAGKQGIDSTLKGMKEWLAQEGHTVVSEKKNGILEVESYTGERMQFVPESNRA